MTRARKILRILAIYVAIMIAGNLLWSAMMWVDLLPEWMAPVGGVIIGVSTALWVYPRVAGRRRPTDVGH